MKILAISLLRLGDILLTVPALKALRSEYPHAEIHLLINRQFAGVVSLIPWVHKTHLFDREKLQESLTNPDRPLLEPYDELGALVDQLNQEKFDKTINLTQNRASGYLTALLKCDEKLGLTFDQTGIASFGSPWFRYLNDYVAGGGRDVFHYADVYFFGSGLKTLDRTMILRETQAGQQEAQAITESKSIILVQPLTSDSKKNWGLQRWAQTLKDLQCFQPGYDYFLLGAPFERDKLQECKSICESLGVKVELAICSFEGAFSLLSRAELLLTGDTSIKHLACAADCKILEVSIGSSDYRKTGVYKPDSLIVQSKEGCAPCPHSSPCSRAEHDCAKRLSSEIVSLAAHHYLANSPTELLTVAREFRDQAEIYRTVIGPSGYWIAQRVGESFNSQAVERWIDRSSWKCLLEKEHEKKLGEFGSESLKLKMGLDLVFRESSREKWKHVLNDLERATVARDSKIEELLKKLASAAKTLHTPETIDEFLKELKVFNVENFDDPQVREFIEACEGQEFAGNEFVYLRKVQSSLREIFYRNQIKLKLVRSLKSFTTETV